MNLRGCILKTGRKLSYREYNRQKAKPGVEYSHLEFGTWLSPRGQRWRPCGLHYPGILLVNWDAGRAHSIAYGTFMRMTRLGWTWVSDKNARLPNFKISRWPDGTHFYLLNADGDPIGKGKFDTYDEAHAVGLQWQEERTQ